MDIEFLKTFVEVNHTRHFGKAAENLFVTQSTVSARIRLLEVKLGAPFIYTCTKRYSVNSYGTAVTEICGEYFNDME